MTSAPPDGGYDEGTTPEPRTPDEPVAPTRRSPAVRIAAALAILLILAALWILTWAVVSGALTSEDGPFGDRASGSTGIAFTQPPASIQTSLLR